MRNISGTIADVPTMNRFLKQLPGIIQRYLPLKRAIIFYKNDTGSNFAPYSQDIEVDPLPSLDEKSNIIRSFVNRKGAVLVDGGDNIYREIFNKNTGDLLEHYGLNLLVPLYCRHYYRGLLVCFLDPKKKHLIGDIQRLITDAAHIFIPVIETERLEVENDRNYYRLFKFDRLVLLGEMVAAIAHELKTPMATVMLEVQEMSDVYARHKGLGRACKKIKNEIQRINQFIRSLLSFSKFEEISMETVALNDFVPKTLTEIPGKRIPERLDISTHLEDNHLVSTDKNRLRQVFFNLIFNAFDAAGPGGEITVKTYTEFKEADQDSRHIIAIRDNGPGIPDDIKEKVLEPFFTTKSQGTGLGLYISYGIMRSLQGDLEIESSSNGTTVYMILPGD
jgi:signal transduction histidine kinase